MGIYNIILSSAFYITDIIPFKLLFHDMAKQITRKLIQRSGMTCTQANQAKDALNDYLNHLPR